MIKKFYHVALKRNLPSIKKYGLLKKGQSWDKKLKAVFFWDTLAMAQSFCDDKAVILEVQIPEGVEILRIWNEALFIYDYCVCQNIPPTCIKTLESATTKEMICHA